MFKLSQYMISQSHLNEVQENLDQLKSEINSATFFVKKIEEGVLDVKYPNIDENEITSDSLSGSLISMRNKLVHLNKEDLQRKWTSDGLALFNEILRKNGNDLQEACYQIISNLIKYIKANQGAIYVVKKDKQLIEQIACYAYDRKKYIDQTFQFGEGLIGQIYLEKETLLLHDVPKDFVQITSGLGEAAPNAVIIVPLKVNQEVEGIIELASFKEFRTFEIEFLEKLGESVASTLSNIKVTQQTKLLLEESQQQSESLKAQEEELRQNMEELSATQEELVRKQQESSNILEKFNLITQTTKEGLWDMVVPANMDINDHTPFFWTDRFRQMLGYTNETDFPNVLHSWSDLLHPHDKENTLNAFAEHLNDTTGNTPYDVEYQLKLKNGEYRWFRAIGNTLRNPQGKPIRIAGSLIDIQALKDMQSLQNELELKIEERTKEVNKLLYTSKEKNEQLTAQEEELRQNIEEMQATQEALALKNKEIAKNAAESASVIRGIDEVMCTIEFTPNGIIHSANANFLKVMNYDLEDIQGKHHQIFVPEEIVNTPKYEAFWKKLARGESVSKVFKRINADKKTVWLNAIYAPILDEEHHVIKVVKFATDVTNSQKISSETKSIYQGIDKVMAVIEFSPLGDIITANENFLHTMKYSLEDIKGKHHQIFMPKDMINSSEYQLFWEKLAAGQAISQIFQRIDAHGDIVWLNAIYTPIIDTEGHVTKVVKLATDISQEKKKEIQVSELLEESRAKEEELRQSMEEVTATQEELHNQIASSYMLNSELDARMAVLNESTILSESDIYGNIIYVNDKFCEVSQYSREELLGNPHKMVRHSDTPKAFFKAFWTKIQAGEVFRGYLKNRKIDGTPYYVDAVISPVLDENGKPVKYIAARYVIENVELAEKLLKEQNIYVS